MPFVGRQPIQSARPDLVRTARHWADAHADRRAFVMLTDGQTPSEELTYGQLDRRCRAIAAELQSRGLAGERALLVYAPGLDFITAFFGCLYAGITAVPTYPPRRNRMAERFRSTARDAAPRIALTTDALAQRAANLADDFDLTWLATDAIHEDRADRWHQPDLAPTDPAMLQYTSGSTGTPRGVIVTHDNLAHNSACIEQSFGSAPDGVGVTWLPPYHDMGLIGAILQTIHVGGPSIVLPPMSVLSRPLRWLRAISQYRGTISGGPNFIYDLCVRKISPEDRRRLDLSSWNVAFNGAEPIRPETLERFAEAFADCGFRRQAFLPCYGLAESTLMVTGAGGREPRVESFDDAAGSGAGRRLVSCGPPIPDHRVLIVDPHTHETLPDGRIGEIWTAGPSVAAGYFNKPHDSQSAFESRLADGDGPFLRTGDLGLMRDGELFCTGRLKDLIIVRGVNHYPHDIEQTARNSHNLLAGGDGAAFSADIDGAQRIVLVHEVERNGHDDFSEVIDAITRAVAERHDLALDGVVLVRGRTVPRTTSGKVQRRACARLLADDELNVIAQRLNWPAGPTGAASKPAQAGAALDLVMGHARELAGPAAGRIDPDTPLAALGLDSLQRLELVALLEKTLDAPVPDEAVAEAYTCGDLARAVERHLSDARRRTARRNGRVPPEHYRIERFAEYGSLQRHLGAMGQANPYFRVHEGLTEKRQIIDGQAMINFCSYDYLGLAHCEPVIEAAKQAIDRYGTSSNASRLVFGEKTVHGELERELAEHYGVDAALAFVSGHATNVTTIGHLLDQRDLVVHDALAHNSIIQGAMLSGAARRTFAHNDYRALDEMLTAVRRQYRRVLIAIEGVYSMDGDMPDLPRFVELKHRHHALLLVDEAHAMGTVGQTGRGSAEQFGIDSREVDIWMGTLSKALGSCGGYIAGSEALVEYLKYTAPGFVYSVGMSPPNAAAACAALRLLHAEPQRVATLSERFGLFRRLAVERRLDIGTPVDTPVVPVMVGRSLTALRLTAALAERGINVSPILHPAVPEHAARLRFFVTVDHTPGQIAETVDAVAESLAAVTADANAPTP